mgnify:CR=1 FL=1
MMNKKNSWKIDLKDVSIGGGGFMRSGRQTSRWTKQPSIMDEKSKNIELIHKPTQITVNGEVPLGHYSKKEMQHSTEALKTKLFLELETKVAKYLRIPGRSKSAI